MKKLQVPLKLHGGKIAIAGGAIETNIILPPGCEGVMFAFKTKKAAREFMGNDADILTLAYGEADNAK